MYAHRCQRPGHPLFGGRLLISSLKSGHIHLLLLQFHQRATLLLNHSHSFTVFFWSTSLQDKDSTPFHCLTLSSVSSEWWNYYQVGCWNAMKSSDEMLSNPLVKCYQVVWWNAMKSSGGMAHCHWLSTSPPPHWWKAAGQTIPRKAVISAPNIIHAHCTYVL